MLSLDTVIQIWEFSTYTVSIHYVHDSLRLCMLSRSWVSFNFELATPQISRIAHAIAQIQLDVITIGAWVLPQVSTGKALPAARTGNCGGSVATNLKVCWPTWSFHRLDSVILLFYQTRIIDRCSGPASCTNEEKCSYRCYWLAMFKRSLEQSPAEQTTTSTMPPPGMPHGFHGWYDNNCWKIWW